MRGSIRMMWKAAVLAALFPFSLMATDYYWTNTGTAGVFSNAANWGPGFNAVPGPADNALFTNGGAPTVNWSADVVNASASFSPTNNTVSLAIGTNAWALSDSLQVSPVAGRTGTVRLVSGSLVITNGSGTGRLLIGERGVGSFNLNSGTLSVNQLWATNNVLGGATNSTFNFNGGTLITSNAANQVAASISVQSNQTFYSPAGNYDIRGNWTMLGGTNIVTMLYTNYGIVKGYVYVGAGMAGSLVLGVGSNAVLSIPSGVLSFQSPNNTLAITNGGRALLQSVVFGSSGNRVLVADPGSALYTTTGYSPGTVIVSNGAAAYSGGTVNMDVGTILVTGAGSIMSNAGSQLAIGRSGSFSSVTVSDGGTLLVPSTTVGGGGGGTYTGNTLIVTGPGSALTNMGGGLSLGDNGIKIYGRVVVSNGARIANLGAGLTIGTGANGGISNSVQVVGANSVITNNGSVVVGNQANATYSTLTIQDGAQVIGQGGSVGSGGSSFNRVTLQNGALWDLQNGMLGWGTASGSNNLLEGDTSSCVSNVAALTLNDAGRTVYLTNGLWMNGVGVRFSGGVLRIGTGALQAPVGLVMSNFTLNASGATGAGGLFGGSCSNTVVTITAGSLWNLGGGGLTNGAFAGGTNNTLVIDGAGGGAVVTNAGALTLGNLAGSGWNTVVLTNGALLANAGTATIGNATPSNTLAIRGSTWLTGGTLYVGSGTGQGNQLIVDGQGIEGGALVTITNTAQPFVNGGTLLVTNGGQFRTKTSMTLGNGSSRNIGRIIGGGEGGASSLFLTPGFILSYSAGDSNNTMLIDGAGVESGAVVSNVTTFSVGGAAGSHANFLIVTNRGRLYAGGNGGTVISLSGFSGSSNNLTLVAAGGKILFSNIGTGGILVGYQPNASYNRVIVRGEDSLIDLGGAGGVLTIGSGSATTTNYGNKVRIEAGGLVSNGSFRVGASSNVFSAGLTLASGGRWIAGPSAAAFSIGSGGGVTNNTVLVTGAGSLLGGMPSLTLGSPTSTNNSLTITDGGAVDNLGTLTVHSNNSLILAGGLFGASSLLYTNGLFAAGDGSQPATLKAPPGGSLQFQMGLLVSSNAELTGAGTVSGAGAGVSLANGATVAPGLSGAGTLNVAGSGLAWAPGSTLRCEITNLNLGFGSGWDLLNVSSQLVIGAGAPKAFLRMDSRGAPAAGFDATRTYALKIVNYGSATGFDTNQITVDQTDFEPAGYEWSLQSSNNALWLVYQGTAPNGDANFVWNVPSNGNWSSAGNWAGGAAPAAVGDAANVLLFGDNGTPYNASNNLAGAFTLNKLVLANVSGKTNILRGNPLAFAANGGTAPRIDFQTGGGGFVVSNAFSLSPGFVFGGEAGGTLVLASNVTGGQPFAKEGPWTLALGASNQFGGPVVMTAGVLRLDHNLALGANSLVVSNGGTVAASVAMTFGNSLYREGLVTGSGSIWSNSATLAVGTNAVVKVEKGGMLAGGLSLASRGSVPYALILTNGGYVYANAPFAIGSTNTVLLVAGGEPDRITALNGPDNHGMGGSNNVLRIDGGGVPGSAAVTNINILSVAGTSNGVEVVRGGRLGTTAPKGTLYSGRIGENGSYNYVIVDDSTWDSANVLLPVGLGTTSGTTGNWVRVQNNGLIRALYLIVGYQAAIHTANGVVVTNGGRVAALGANSSRIGSDPRHNQNYMIVAGAGSVWEGTANPLMVGVGGTGNWLRVAASGVMTNAGLSVGSDPTGLSNRVEIVSGGKVYPLGETTVGRLGASGNQFLIAGAGSLLNMGGRVLNVGGTNASGIGNSLTIDQGGSAENIGWMTNFAGNPVNLYGGTLAVSNWVNTNGVFVAGDGLQDATLKGLGGLWTIPAGLTVTNSATLTGAGTIAATTTVYGAVNPGAAVGVLTNSGDLVLTAGASSIIELAAYTAPGAGWDLLAVTNGLLQLDGSLVVRLNGGFAPTNSQRFVVMTNYGPQVVSGSFANMTLGKVAAYSVPGGKPDGYFTVTVGAKGVVLDAYAPRRPNPGAVVVIW